MRIITHPSRKKSFLGLTVAALLAAWPVGGALAQPAADAAAPPPPPASPVEPLPPAATAGQPQPGAPPVPALPAAPAPPSGTEPPPAAPPSPTPTQLPPPPLPQSEEYIALPINPNTVPQRRTKILKTTVGIAPTSADLGSETDLAGVTSDTAPTTVYETQKWSFAMKGYLRAPMRFSCGERDDSYPGGNNFIPVVGSTLFPGCYEVHSPPRMAAGSSSNWSYIAVAPNPVASLYAAVTNPRVVGVVILTANTFPQVGYADLDQLGGLSQAYVTLKFADAFGSRGGLAWTVGSFSHRYGTAGPRQTNAGYYSTYLFGRTHVVGSVLTANFDLNDHVEVILEHGFGAKLDLLPRLGESLPKQMYVPGDPAAALGSNYLHHAHAGLRVDDWLKLGAHYLTSWTPNDHATTPGAREARLSVVGGDVHYDHPRWGNGYVGYSYVWGENLMPLDNALQVIHGSRGYDFKLQFFGNKLRYLTGGSTGSYISNDGGNVHSVLFQYQLRSYQLMGYTQARRGLALGVFGMYSRAYSPPHPGDAGGPPTQPGLPPTPARVIILPDGSTAPGPFTVNENKLKFGAILDFSAFRFLSFAFRADRVQPSMNFDPEASYTALSPQLIFRTNWKSKEYVIVNYTRYFLGAHIYPDSPYSGLQKVVDKHLFVISAVMSL